MSCDLSELDGLGDLVKSIRAEFGPVYGLVNNAAMADAGILTNVRDHRIEDVVRLNL